MRTCSSCLFWMEYRHGTKHGGGLCENEKIGEDLGDEAYARDALVYPYNEGVDYFWTGPLFGCVHHKEK